MFEFAEQIDEHMFEVDDSAKAQSDVGDGRRLKQSARRGAREMDRSAPIMPLHKFTLTPGPTARPNRRCARAGCNCPCSCGCCCDIVVDESKEKHAHPASVSSAKASSHATTASANQDADKTGVDHSLESQTDLAALLSDPNEHFPATTALPCSRQWDAAQKVLATVANRWLTINPDY